MESTERFTASLRTAQGTEVMQSRSELIVVEIHDRLGTRTVEAAGEQVTGGGHEVNPFVIHDPAVSGVHFELLAMDEGVRLHDLGSKNGTWLSEGINIVDAVIKPGTKFRVGSSTVALKAIDVVDVPISTEGQFGRLRGPGAKMNELFAKLTRLAPMPLDVLLSGETGTGKDLIANGLHARSQRSQGPFIVLDCTTLNESIAESTLFGHRRGTFTGALDQPGLLEQADGGTLFIDEIGELPISLQPKLLRALETQQTRRIGDAHFRSFDARLISATHRDLRKMVNKGEFREDLFFRLAQVQLSIPPLRDRGRSDLVHLADLFLEGVANERGTKLSFHKDVYGVLNAHPWPGNVRELRNVVRCAAMFCKGTEVTVQDLPELATLPAPNMSVKSTGSEAWISRAFSSHISDARSLFERAYAQQLMAKTGGNQSVAAKHAKMTRGAFRELLKRVGLL